MREPSEKQVKYAKKMCKWTGVELPEEYSAQAYWKYISENVEKYKCERARAQIRAEHQKEEIAYDKRKKLAWKKQKDSDWAALNIDSSAFFECVSKGEYNLPSWMPKKEENFDNTYFESEW